MAEPNLQMSTVAGSRKEVHRKPYQPPMKAWWGAVIGAGLAAYSLLTLLSTRLDTPLTTVGDMLVVLLAGALVTGVVGLAAAVLFALIQRAPTVWAGGVVGLVAAVVLYLSVVDNPLLALLFGVALVLPAALLGGAVGLGLERSWSAGTALMLAVGLVLSAGVALWLVNPGTGKAPAPLGGPAVAALNEPDPSKPGTYQVRTLTYGSGTDRRRPEYGSEAAIKAPVVDVSPLAPGWSNLRSWYWGFDETAVPLGGRVWYPAGEGPFPLVLILHGNHAMTAASDKGYGYLGGLLASKGFIAVSVDENFLGTAPWGEGGGNEATPARAWLLLQHLEYWGQLNANAGTPFYRRVDMGNIALVGHSRGGEAAYLAAVMSNLSAFPDNGSVKLGGHFNIKSVAAIAPTDQYWPSGKAPALENVNYLVLQGANDGDTFVFEGARAYQRTQLTEGSDRVKAALYIYGANHSQFNTRWGRRDFQGLMGTLNNTRPVMAAEQQRQVAEVYLSAFLSATLKGRREYLPLLQDSRVGQAWLPPAVYVSLYEDGSMRRVSGFEEDMDLLTTTEPGGMIEEEGLNAWREADLKLRSGVSRENHAAYLAWGPSEGSPAAYSIVLPDSRVRDWQVSADHVLTFTLADARQAARGQDPLDFTVELVDGNGAGARLPLSRFAAVPPPGLSQKLFKLGALEGRIIGADGTVLQTYRLPLSAFAAGTGFDPAALKTVRFRFDRTREGAVWLDDVGFALLAPH